jgi:hypothetical protein
MKKFFRYLIRDKVDFILLLILISLLIIEFNNSGLLKGILSIFILYVLGVTWRMGKAMDIINEYVIDRTLRISLGMHPIPGEHYIKRKTWFARIIDIIFWLALIVVLTYFIITNI